METFALMTILVLTVVNTAALMTMIDKNDKK